MCPLSRRARPTSHTGSRARHLSDSLPLPLVWKGEKCRLISRMSLYFSAGLFTLPDLNVSVSGSL